MGKGPEIPRALDVGKCGADGTGGSAIDLADLQRALAAAEPSAVLVPARVLRRVAKSRRGLPFFGGAAARQPCLAIAGAALAAIVSPREVGLPDAASWPETVYLLERPEPADLCESPPGVLLTEAWRRLFRVRARETVREAFATGALDPTAFAARVESIGRTEFEEARAVLLADGFLFAEDDEAETYAAFAAVFLELTTFSPALRSSTFPAIERPADVEALLAADLDAHALFAATRPAGAPDPSPDGPTEGEEEGPTEGGRDVGRGTERGGGERARDGRRVKELEGRRARRLSALAKGVADRGNNVRAAILWARAAAAEGGGSDAGELARAASRAQLKHLANRLQKALFVRKGEAELWADALTPLLRRAAEGFWSPEARLLYDLQKVCLDHERESFRLEPLRWLLSAGRSPLKRPLPHLREVTMSNHLRSAARRLAKVRLTREDRTRLDSLLRPAVHHAGLELRERFRPRVVEALDEAWVRPRGVVERVARRKLVEELLDQVVGRGFSTLGDLRDSASRSNLKIPDVAGPGEFFQGGRLLAADRALAERLDGVHRPGEIYLRWLQRLSALAFGTPPGRFVTLFLALPYGGAFVVLKGLEELDALVVSRLTGVHVHPVNVWSILLLGTVALGAINYVRFRAVFLRAVAAAGRWLRGVVLDLPARLIHSPWLRRMVRSPAVRLAWNLGFKPALAAVPFWAVARLDGVGPRPAAWFGGATFLAASLMFNTEAGRSLEEAAVEEVGRAFKALAFDVFPGLFHLVMAAFQDVLDWVEKLIYAVDEWLRFRSGQSAVSLAVKSVLGLVWGVLAYLIRIYVNLLIEPQVNPIKHFPVVTVSHKVILPLSLKLTAILAAILAPFLGKDLGTFVAAANVLLLPGVFGFLVWELKSNWRLYEANRPKGLVPVMVGSHGETVVGLLRRGFHSGTLPKQFGRLRRARRDGRDKAVEKRRETLHHAEESLRRFVERDFTALLEESRPLGRAGVGVGTIRLATNRIRVELIARGFDAPGFTLDVEERPGVLAAGVSLPGWLIGLDGEARCAVNAALLGLLKMSGVERVQTPGAPVDPPPPGALRLDDVAVDWRTWAEGWDEEGEGGPVPDRFQGLPAVVPVTEPVPAR